jgi:hypothetical protein
VGFDARIEICPERWGQPGLSNDATLVFLGSQIYNSGTYHYVQQRTDILKNVSFHRQPETGVRFLRVNSGGHLEGWYSPYGAHVGVQDMPVLAPELVASEPKTDFGFIQRINERIGQNEQRTVFVCAGLGAAATLACADYLGKSWRKIYKQCGTHEFQLLLRLDNQNPNEIPSAEPKVGFIAPNY